MFQNERRGEIERLVRVHGRVETEDLAQRFGVSADSIRKDLQYLSKHHRCERVYGGAVAIEPVSSPTPAAAVAPARTADPAAGDEGRRAVAYRAFQEINPGDAVFLDISRTNLFLADLIAESGRRCIVTTNMLGVLQRLANLPNVTALATGGYMNIDMSGFIGSATVSLLEPLLFSKAFIGAGGVDLTGRAVMTISMDDGAVKSRALSNASKSYLLAEAAKFGLHDTYRFASINDFSAVITDARDRDVLHTLRAEGVAVLLA